MTAENQGSVEHDFVVLDQGREIAAETDLPEDLEEVRAEWAVVSLHTDPGTAETGTFTAPAAGDYQIICMVPGHFSAGMEGTLTVTGKEARGSAHRPSPPVVIPDSASRPIRVAVSS